MNACTHIKPRWKALPPTKSCKPGVCVSTNFIKITMCRKHGNIHTYMHIISSSSSSSVIRVVKIPLKYTKDGRVKKGKMFTFLSAVQPYSHNTVWMYQFIFKNIWFVSSSVVLFDFFWLVSVDLHENHQKIKKIIVSVGYLIIALHTAGLLLTTRSVSYRDPLLLVHYFLN